MIEDKKEIEKCGVHMVRKRKHTRKPKYKECIVMSSQEKQENKIIFENENKKLGEVSVRKRNEEMRRNRSVSEICDGKEKASK